METPLFLQAIRAIWDQLPELVGPAWPDLERQLLDYMQRLEGAAKQASDLQQWISILLQDYPRAYARLLAQLDESPESKGSRDYGTTRDISESLIRGLTGDEIARVVRYTDISYPRRVWIKTPRLSVIVRLTVRRPVDSAFVKELTLQEGASVRVHIEAPVFEILNDSEQDTPILHEGNSPALVFDLRPLQAGHGQIRLDFFQQGNHVGTTELPIEVSLDDVEVAAGLQPAYALSLAPQVPPPDQVLHVAWQENPPQLIFTLIRDGGAWWRTFAPTSLSGSPATYMARLYGQLTSLVGQTDPTVQSVLNQRRVIPPDDAERQIKRLGQNLWREIFPQELKDYYASERASWRERTFLVLSDEPHIPWELVWPYEAGRWSDDGPWCQTMFLTRWLRRDDRGNGNAGPPGRLCLQKLAYLVPGDSGLAAAQKEGSWLKSLVARNGFQDASPSVPTRKAVLDLLESGQYDWLHVAAHGNFAVSPDADSALWLEGTSPLTPQAIVGEAEGYILAHRPSFFFNACSVGRQDWSLTHVGGWANRLISAGAGLFLAPLWSVSDGPALSFAQSFYKGITGGQTVAQAVWTARQAAREEGDPTWLAYTVYAHPNAQCQLGH